MFMHFIGEEEFLKLQSWLYELLSTFADHRVYSWYARSLDPAISGGRIAWRLAVYNGRLILRNHLGNCKNKCIPFSVYLDVFEQCSSHF